MGAIRDLFIKSLKPSKDPYSGVSISDGLIVMAHGLTQIWPISPIVHAIRRGLGVDHLFTEPDAEEPNYLDSESHSSEILNSLIKLLFYTFPKQILSETLDFYRSGQWLGAPLMAVSFVPAAIIALIGCAFICVGFILPLAAAASVLEAAVVITRGAIQVAIGTLIASALGVAALAETIAENTIGPAIEKSINIAPKIIPAIKEGTKNLLDKTKGFFAKAGEKAGIIAGKTAAAASSLKNSVKSLFKPELEKEPVLEGITVIPTEKTPLLPPKATSTLAEKIKKFDSDFPSPPTELPPPYGTELPDEASDSDEAPAPAYKGRVAAPQ